MNRKQVEQYVREEYGVMPEYLWEGDRITAVLRHSNTKKWFGIIMRISSRKLGRNNDELIDIVNVKLDPDFIQLLLQDRRGQLYPAYHMNKKHWITILLNNHADVNLIKSLINESYGLTL